MVVGRPQAGKSLLDITKNTILDASFYDSLEERVVYDANGFMHAMNQIVKHKIRGRAVTWDEAGVGMPARKWYDLSNQAISYTIQVAGVFGPFISFVTQDMSYIDSQPRKLINSFFDVSRTNNKYSTAKVFNITVDRRRGKAYFKYPTMITKEGIHIKLSKGIKLTKPPKELIDRYMEHSKPYKEKITQMMEQRTEDFDDGVMEKKDYTISEIVQTLLSDTKKTYELPKSEFGNRHFNRDLIAHDFKIPDKLAAVIKAKAEYSSRQQEIKKEEVKGQVLTTKDAPVL
jgi:hypothetical protein